MGKGKVWLVGAGPSDVGLLTLKAKSILEQAEVVMYDSLVGDGIIGLIPTSAKLINVGKRAGHAVMPQDMINEVLLEEALKGSRVVRLKGGDPFLFGRGGEELELLAEHSIPFEIVPGVTSAIAVPAYAGIPVTHRDFCSSVHIITGHKKDIDKPQIDFEALVKLNGTLVFLMGVGALSYICESLIKAGMTGAMPAAVLENGTKACQRRVVSTLEKLPEEAKHHEIMTPAIIVIGQVCGLSDKFHWAEDRPLGGARVIVTRPQELVSTLSSQLTDLGAEVLELPAIKTEEIEDNEDVRNAIKSLSDYSWLVFTSQAGVKVFFDKLIRNKTDIRALYNKKIAAIGAATEKALTERGLIVDCVPDKFDTIALGKALAATVGPREKLLIPRARIGSTELTCILDEAGIAYTDLPVYDTIYKNDNILQVKDMLERSNVDYVAFTSASTVRGFMSAAGDADVSGLTAVCIGEQTAAEAEKYGMTVIISEKISIDSIVEKIENLYTEKKTERTIKHESRSKT